MAILLYEGKHASTLASTFPKRIDFKASHAERRNPEMIDSLDTSNAKI